MSLFDDGCGVHSRPYSYCHYLMMVVACTAGLIANCDSYLVHYVCMQGCMFRERWGYNAYCSSVLYVNQGAILAHCIRSGHKFLYVNLQRKVNHCLCFVHTTCRFEEIRCQSLSLEVNCGYARMAIHELTTSKQATNTHQIDKGATVPSAMSYYH